MSVLLVSADCDNEVQEANQSFLLSGALAANAGLTIRYVTKRFH